MLKEDRYKWWFFFLDVEIQLLFETAEKNITAIQSSQRWTLYFGLSDLTACKLSTETLQELAILADFEHIVELDHMVSRLFIYTILKK